VRTLRTNRETTPEGFHDEVLSDHITRNREASQQVNTRNHCPPMKWHESGLCTRLAAGAGTGWTALAVNPIREP